MTKKKHHTAEETLGTENIGEFEPLDVPYFVEIGDHKFGVEVIDGQKYVLGAVVNGETLPNPAEALALGYYTKIDSSAALEIHAEQLEQIVGEHE